jgi:hypothetical protein
MDPNTLQPVPDCKVQVKSECPGHNPWDDMTETDQDGYWEICAPCDCEPYTYIAHAVCCGATEERHGPECPDKVMFGDMNCRQCP